MDGRGRRERAATLGRVLGITALMEALPGPPCLLVVNHHRVGDPEACPYDRGVFGATVEELDTQLAAVKKRYPVVGLDEAEELILHPERMSRTHVLFTFDDGYIDNYEIAFPIFQSHGLTATFFLAPTLIGSRVLSDWDRAGYMVRRAQRDQITLRYPVERTFDLAANRELSVGQILLLYYQAGEQDSPRLLEELSEACGVEPPAEAEERLYLNQTEATEMVRAGMSLGSHTYSHRMLSTLSEDEQFRELRDSKRAIEEFSGQSVRTVAYPFGKENCFNEATPRAARRAGYTVGFSFYSGGNYPDAIDPFDVRRFVLPPRHDEAYWRFRLLAAGRLRRVL